MTENFREALLKAWETGGEADLEEFLAERLADKKPEERVAEVRRLAGPPSTTTGADVDRLLRQVFREGQQIGSADGAEQVDRLAEALNLVFDALNRLIAVIDATLYGLDPQSTIRHYVGAHMSGEGEAPSLNDRIDRIQEAFSVSHTAYQSAVKRQAVALLERLDPEAIQAEGNLKFGPFGKADRFRAFEATYRACRDWVESPKFTAEFLREFERNIRKQFAEKGGRT
ncbi:MAG: hypothetical protein ACLFQQ_07220 [Desulfococcaceae bacterium]